MAPDKRFTTILCTDLDGTFIGNDPAMYRLLQLIENKDILLVFSTGRHLSSVQEFINNKKTRNPDACILMVGTEIYLYESGIYTVDERWQETIVQGWDREAIINLASKFRELEIQDREWQTDYKASYYLRQNTEEVLNRIKTRIHREGLQTTIVYSHGEYLDFLPVHAGKAKALNHLVSRFGIEKENVIVCGDSGNDIDMFHDGFKGIIVGNALQELKNFNRDNAYHATASHSAGIIEGLRHFNIIPE